MDNLQSLLTTDVVVGGPVTILQMVTANGSRDFLTGNARNVTARCQGQIHMLVSMFCQTRNPTRRQKCVSS